MRIIWNGEQFSKQLKKKRLIDDDIDMRSLADKIDVSAATISRCENGRMPDLDAYVKLCNYIGQPLDAFVKVGVKNKKK